MKPSAVLHFKRNNPFSWFSLKTNANPKDELLRSKCKAKEGFIELFTVQMKILLKHPFVEKNNWDRLAPFQKYH